MRDSNFEALLSTVMTTHNTVVAYRTSVNTDGPITSESLKKVFDKHISTSKGEVDDYLASNIRPILQQGEFQKGEIYCSNTYCIGHHRDTDTGRMPNERIYNGRCIGFPSRISESRHS